MFDDSVTSREDPQTVIRKLLPSLEEFTERVEAKLPTDTPEDLERLQKIREAMDTLREIAVRSPSSTGGHLEAREMREPRSPEYS